MASVDSGRIPEFTSLIPITEEDVTTMVREGAERGIFENVEHGADCRRLRVYRHIRPRDHGATRAHAGPGCDHPHGRSGAASDGDWLLARPGV